MSKYSTYEQRLQIQADLKENLSFGAIGRQIGKDRTTIAKEIRKHSFERKSGYSGWSYNACKHRGACKIKDVCGKSQCTRPATVYCKLCSHCNDSCPDLEEEVCAH